MYYAEIDISGERTVYAVTVNTAHLCGPTVPLAYGYFSSRADAARRPLPFARAQWWRMCAPGSASEIANQIAQYAREI